MDFTHLLTPHGSMQLFVAIFLGILFLQSGLDKVYDWTGNLNWLREHFERSKIAAIVPVLLATVTIFELMAGLACSIGAIALVISKTSDIALLGAALSSISIIMLFFGQRVAKDYDGAATLVPYFMLSLAGIWILGY